MMSIKQYPVFFFFSSEQDMRFNMAFSLITSSLRQSCQCKLLQNGKTGLQSYKGILNLYKGTLNKTNSKCLSRSFSTSTPYLTTTPLPVFLNAEKYLERTAVIDKDGSSSYADILHHSMNLSTDILSILKSENYENLKGAGNAKFNLRLNGERIALLTEQSISYVIGQYATWIVNGISVPLCASHPPAEWEYFLQDSQCSLVLASESFIEKIKPIAEKLNIPVKSLARQDFSADYDKNRWFQADHASNPK